MLRVFFSICAFILSVQPSLAEMLLMGSIDSHYSVTMSLTRSGNKVSGHYSYSSSGKPIRLDGTIDAANNISIKEFTPDGKNTGVFSGKLVPGKRMFGKWSKAPGNQPLPFVLAFTDNLDALDLGADGIIITDEFHKLPKHNPDFPERTEADVHIPIVNKQGLRDLNLAHKMQESLSSKMLYGQSLGEMTDDIKGGDVWLGEASYSIDYNRNWLVDGDFTVSGVGAYPSQSTKHTLIYTKTGKQLTAREAFNNLPELAALVKKEMRKEIDATIKQQLPPGADFNDLLKPTINADPLASFAVSDSGVTFLHDWQFAHVDQALQPPGRYFLSFKVLSPFIRTDGPLGLFLQPYSN